jgi:acetyl-CoA carboxylase carboxyl transferase subunit beta
MRARARIDWYADSGSFVEEAAEVRSEDPLEFFDLRPYAERLAEAELNTGLGEAAVIGHATMDGHPVELAVMDFHVHGRLDGERGRREVLPRVRLGDRAWRAARLGHVAPAAPGCRRGSSR